MLGLSLGPRVHRLAQPHIAEILDQQQPLAEVARQNLRRAQSAAAQPFGDCDEGARVLVGRRRIHQHRLPRAVADARSEEHTSELQSLMRISYAVFCLKKKKTTTIKQ